jgi:hypothetical protein
LQAVRAARPGVEIETIEVLAHPARVLRERVLMIPLVEIGDKRWHQAPSLETVLAALDAEPMV